MLILDVYSSKAQAQFGISENIQVGSTFHYSQARYPVAVADLQPTNPCSPIQEFASGSVPAKDPTNVSKRSFLAVCHNYHTIFRVLTLLHCLTME